MFGGKSQEAGKKYFFRKCGDMSLIMSGGDGKTQPRHKTQELRDDLADNQR
jgi:hypothetical protein